MKAILPAMLLASYLLLTSCDPYGVKELVVYNTTGSPIVVERGSAAQIDTSYTVQAGQTLQYYKNSGIQEGGVDQVPQNNVMEVHQLYRIRRDSSVCKKDHNTYSNWADRKNGKRDHTFTFIVTDADF